jgi:CubicO group peptidase (beta-lactamase class C family)
LKQIPYNKLIIHIGLSTDVKHNAFEGGLLLFLSKQLSNQYDSLIEYAEEINRLNSGTATSIIVIHNDKIVTEHYSGYHSQLPNARQVKADSQFNVGSVRKSYIGLAVAIAIHEGRIQSIDDPVSDYLPNLDRTLMEGTTIRHLLTHTHGLTSDNHGNLIREFHSGSNWSYRNEGVEMLTQIILQVMGVSVAQLIKERISLPLEFTETGWQSEENARLVKVVNDSHGQQQSMAEGVFDLFVSAKELAYWGYLHLKKGRIGDNKVVPEAVIELSTSLQSPLSNDKDLPQHGFFWYVKDSDAKRSEIGEIVPVGSFQIVGLTGPLVLVIPENDIVVVRMYNKLYNYGGENYLHYFREFGNRVMACL